jgi:hypothetical protein
VVVIKVTLGDVEVQAGRFASDPWKIDPITPFQAGNDWIHNLTIHLFNRTNRIIVCANIVLIFPETGDGHTKPWHVSNLNLGQIPPAAAIDRNGQAFPQPPDRQHLSFGPGQTMVIALGDYIDRIRSVESAIPLAAATKLRISLSSFYFRGGMKFAAGGYSTPDPQIPGNWLHPGPDHFPGDMEGRWPGRPGWVGHQ